MYFAALVVTSFRIEPGSCFVLRQCYRLRCADRPKNKDLAACAAKHKLERSRAPTNRRCFAVGNLDEALESTVSRDGGIVAGRVIDTTSHRRLKRMARTQWL